MTDTEIKTISPTLAAKKLTEKKAVIVDVRDKSEWDEMHIPGAIHIPVNDLKKRITELDVHKELSVVIHCRNGAKRAVESVTQLNNAGFKHAFNLEGGILAWEKEGFDIKKGKSE